MGVGHISHTPTLVISGGHTYYGEIERIHVTLGVEVEEEHGPSDEQDSNG